MLPSAAIRAGFTADDRAALTRSLARAAVRHGMVPVELPFGMLEEGERPGLEFLCAFRTPEKNEIFSVMLWAEVRDGRLVARLQHYHPGWHRLDTAARVWRGVSVRLVELFGERVIREGGT